MTETAGPDPLTAAGMSPPNRLPEPEPESHRAPHEPGIGLGQVIRTATLVQHILFGVLLAVGVIRALVDGTSPALLGVVTVVFVGWYAVGVALARRPGPAWLRPSRWFLGLVLAWLALVLVSPEFVWLGFSLWLLAGHLLPPRVAVAVSLGVLAVVVLAPTLATGAPLGVAGVVGPAVGCLFASALSTGQQRLVHESAQRERLVASLFRAQAESDRLGAELAAAQHESGILAERTRLSREIHDTLAQGFSSILLLARAAPRTDGLESGASGASSAAGRQAQLLRQIEESATENLLEARRVVGALAPEHLDGSGLVSALRRILESVSAQTTVATELRVEGEVDGLPTGVEVALLRAAQGALANVRQHADASRVVVTLTDAGDSVRLDVVDDGHGFDAAAWALAPPSPPELGGYGLRSSRARLRELGGGLEIESRPGSGTALSAYVPLHVTASPTHQPTPPTRPEEAP